MSQAKRDSKSRSMDLTASETGCYGFVPVTHDHEYNCVRKIKRGYTVCRSIGYVPSDLAEDSFNAQKRGEKVGVLEWMGCGHKAAPFLMTAPSSCPSNGRYLITRITTSRAEARMSHQAYRVGFSTLPGDRSPVGVSLCNSHAIAMPGKVDTNLF